MNKILSLALLATAATATSVQSMNFMVAPIPASVQPWFNFGINIALDVGYNYDYTVTDNGQGYGDGWPTQSHDLYTNIYSFANATVSFTYFNFYQFNCMISFIPFNLFPYGHEMQITDLGALLLDADTLAAYGGITLTNYGWWALDVGHIVMTHNYQMVTC